MAGLVKMIGGLVRKKKEERFIIFGNDYSGKTTILYRLKLGEVVTTIPTMGFNVETIQHSGYDYTLWDVGGCDKIRPLWRHYMCPRTHVLYVHNCGDDAERDSESFEGLHQNIEMMLDVGATNVWVIFNKQDLLPTEKRATVVNGLRQEFERQLNPYKEKGIIYEVLDLPGFSAVSGEQLYELLPAIHTSLEMQRKNPHAKSQQPSKSAPSPPSASIAPESELIARIEKEGANESEAEVFWNAFLSCSIPEWNHRSHLRAGYITLLETLKDGKGIFDSADTFLDHLKRLKESKPERFRNTEHRSMTIFWLYQLQLAVLSFKHDKNFEKWPAWDDFQSVLLNSPQLMDGGLWKIYFSKELLFSPEAKEYWRLPDLQALPDLVQMSPSRLKQHIRRNSQEEMYRVMRFAFTVVQKYMSSNVRRGLVVKQALASLQSTTMRLRAKNASIPPYSETQAYFWIQIIHAALASEAGRAPSKPSTEELSLHVPLHQLSFSSFRVLFDIEPALWSRYYTSKTWESIEARMLFVNPDVKALPNIISIPSADNIGRALDKQLDNANLGTAAELPSMEDLAFRAAMVLEDAKDISEWPTEIVNHAHLLYFLHNHLVTSPSAAESVANKAASVMMQMSGPYIPTFTLKSFWTQQVLGASLRDGQASSKDPRDTSTPTFEAFLKANLHLVYEDLPLCYYSPELLQSLDAKERLVAPDKRKMRGFFAIEGKEQEDEWVIL